MSSNFNNAKVINVYYNKGDRKPYDVNGKPIAYIGEEFVGANEATEIRFHFGEELDSSSAIIVAKRANGDTRLDPLTLVGTGVNSYFKIELNAWYAEYKGKMTIIFKAYNGTVTYDDAENPTQIVSTTGQIIVSDIFNLDVGYAPNASSLVPPFETEDYDDWFFTLSTKLDKAQSITVVGALPTLTGGVYDDRYFYVEDEGVGRLYYINGSTAIEIVWGIGQLNFATTGVPSAALTAGQVRYNDTTGSLDLGLKGNHVLKMGEVLVKRVRNADASSLKVGQLVYVFGAVGASGLLEVKKASNIGELTSSKTFGMVATAMNTTSSKDGYVYLYGLLQGVNLNDTDVGEGSFSSGDVGSQLWLGESGKITKTLPTADTKHSVFVGYLDSYQGSGSNCGIYTKIQNGYELNELHNVRISSVADNQILRYNSTRGVWENTSELTTAETDINNIESGTTIVGKANADKDGNEFDATYLKKASASSTYVPLSSKGVANGVVPLNADNKISSIYLSGEQDDFVEYANLAAFPAVGEADIIYCAIDTGIIYRWTGSTYAIISPSLALGTTATTAFAGDRGLATETKTDNIVNGTQGLTNTRITNSAVGTQPLIVNAIASTTANLINAQVNTVSQFLVSAGGNVEAQGTFRTNSGLRNLTATDNSYVNTSTNGTTISRNVADANPTLIVRKQLGTGNILELQTGTSDKKLEVDVNGWLYQNGTRLFHATGNVNNTFFGLTSGGTTTSGQLNSAFGNGSLSVLTSGSANSSFGVFSLGSLLGGSSNTAIGRASLFNLTSGGSNTSIGVSSGQTLTTGSNNTFVGFDAGNNASQLATATNSTAIGNGSFTDASNQMVFGNASVTQFKFDRNASAVLLAPNLGVNRADASFRIDVVSTFGNEAIRALRQGSYGQVIRLGRNGVSETTSIDYPADGTFAVSTASTERLRITSGGNVGIGITAPITNLQVNTSANSTFAILAYRQSSITNDHAGIGFKISDNAGVGTVKGSITFRRQAGNGRGSLLFLTNDVADDSDVSTTDERMRITSSGLVGIGETTPTAQLQVKSGATGRVPLIVDSLTGHATDLQYWRVNGSTLAWITSTGNVVTPQIQSNSNSNNSRIQFQSDGTNIIRNVADSNPALIVNLTNASSTGHIQVWQSETSAKAHITRTGIFVGQSRPTRTDITASATLALADEGKVLRVNSSSNLTITIPLNSSVAFPIDTEIAILRYGTGTVSISPTSGVTLQSANAERKIRNQYGSVALKKIGDDEWVLVGSLEA